MSYGPHFASEPVDASRNTALHIVAAQMGGEEASDRIHVLLAMGANVEARNIEGALPGPGRGTHTRTHQLNIYFWLPCPWIWSYLALVCSPALLC